jgi:hypothetical protein
VWLANKDRDLSGSTGPLLGMWGRQWQWPQAELHWVVGSAGELSQETAAGQTVDQPSLPHTFDDIPVPSSSSFSRRPRSAGEDAEPEPPHAAQRKLGSNYSPLNLLRKVLLPPQYHLPSPWYHPLAHVTHSIELTASLVTRVTSGAPYLWENMVWERQLTSSSA